MSRATALTLMTAASLSILSVAATLLIYLPIDAETTTGEGAPLAVCWRVRTGQTVYDDWRSGPIYLAIYGPLYYQFVGRAGALLGADREGLVLIARILSMAAAAAVGLMLYATARRGGLSPAAATAALLPLTWMPTEALRFLASARPDAPALAASVAALSALLRTQPRWTLAAALAVAALWLKPTAMPPLLTVVAAAAIAGAPRSAWIRVVAIIGLGTLAVLGLNAWTAGGLAEHLFSTRHAPQALSNSVDLVRRHVGVASTLIGAPLAAVLLRRAAHRSGSRAEAADESPFAAHFIASYGLLAPVVALAFARREGSDANYFLETAAALGFALPALLRRLAAEKRVTIPAWLLLFVTLLTFPPLRITDALTLARAPLSALTRPLCEWTASQPGPLLCMEPWLAYRSGAGGHLADRIAYTSLVRARPDLDVLTPLVHERRFATIILYGSLEDAKRRIYGDVPYLWPQIIDAIRAHYRERDRRFGWRAYEPR